MYLGQWSCMAGVAFNPYTKFEDSTPIRFWVMSYDVFHRPSLSMHLEWLRMRRITWRAHRRDFFHISNPLLVYSPCNFYGFAIKINRVMRQNSVRPWNSSMRQITKSMSGALHVTRTVLSHVDFVFWAWKFGDLAAFRSIFNDTFTAHAQTWLFVSLRWKFWHRHSIRWPWIRYRARYFGDLRTLSVDFVIV